MIYPYLRTLLFSVDPERAHELVLHGLAAVGRSRSACELLRQRYRFDPPRLKVRAFGLTFPNPVGLAAGFDKDALAPHVLASLGFGFVEVGTLTPRPQPGNPRPRMVRLPDDLALINRLGFNNRGAAAAAARLAALRERQGGVGVPLGVNIGKNKTTPNAQAAEDYRQCLRVLFPYADYFVVNVSSPNTPDLRQLQRGADLRRLLEVLQEENAARAAAAGTAPRPLLVKIAPDLTTAEIEAIVDAALGAGAAGVIATNTTVRRPPLRSAGASQPGGLSGRPLRELSNRIIATVFHLTGGRLPIVGVGGVFSGDDAYDKIRAGATLVQVYTGFVYEGPSLAARINRRLLQRLTEDGFESVTAAVGTAADVWAARGEPSGEPGGEPRDPA